MLIEIWEQQTKQCVGYLKHNHDTAPAIRIENHDWSVEKQVINVRVKPGHFAHFTVLYMLLPLHIIAAVIESKAFIARGTVEFIKNDNDPELKLSPTKH